MTRAEILEARRQLQRARLEVIRLAFAEMADYDEGYYAALEQLQSVCGASGHTLRMGRCTTCDKAQA